MSLTIHQNKPVVVGSPIEIEKAVNEIRLLLSNLSWIDHPYFIAQRFFRSENGKTFIFPETYAPQTVGSRNYHRLTPDNDFKGMFFFYVGQSRNANSSDRDFLTYPIAIIFSVNLELIDKPKLDQGLFTQELIRDVRKMLIQGKPNFDFDYNIQSETRDLRETFREFSMNEIEQYNRAPMQCFRFDLLLTLQEDC